MGRMRLGFNVFRKLDDGQVLHVASRRDVEQAEHLVAELNNTFPGNYGYREANSERLSGGWGSVSNQKVEWS